MYAKEEIIWQGRREEEKQVLRAFILFFIFTVHKKKEILKVGEVLFFVSSWSSSFRAAKFFVIKLIPSKLSIRQFLIPFRNSVLCMYTYIHPLLYSFASSDKRGIYNLKTGYNQKQCFALFNLPIKVLNCWTLFALEHTKIP